MGDNQPRETLRRQLETARLYDETVRQHNVSGDPIFIPGMGRAISSAYEQLRNAAEYNEGRLVLQRAIKRFYKRLLFVLRRQPDDIGQELLIELAQAGYLQEGQYGSKTADSISKLAVEQMHLYGRLRQAHVPQGKALDWVLSVLSVRTEDFLQPYAYHLALAAFAYEHFLQQLPKDRLAHTAEEDVDYDIALYIAVHQALLKSNIDVARTDLLRLYSRSTEDIHDYIAWNERIDRLYAAPQTRRLKRLVSKNGAPFRVLKGLIEDTPDLADVLPDREQFMLAYEYQIAREYKRTIQRLNSGLIKSIIFIFITKSIIGIGVEVPFDLAVYGTVAMLPLTINLFFPPLYMASIRLGLTTPSDADARATKHYMEQLLYGEKTPSLNLRERAKPYSPLAKLISALLFLIPLGVTVTVLQRLQFNPLQMGIFFVFFSTASFLGFRLGGIVRELKMSRPQATLSSALLDFFYLPFIQLGQWLAGKYAQVNVVGEFLDTAIELPLKSLLRMIRLWIRFLNEKYDELY
jgi:hypothetical protein